MSQSSSEVPVPGYPYYFVRSSDKRLISRFPGKSAQFITPTRDNNLVTLYRDTKRRNIVFSTVLKLCGF